MRPTRSNAPGVLFVCSVLALSAAAAAAPAVVDPRCEYLVNPAGIDSPAPRLSWVLQSDRRGARQAAYQVIVASDAAALRRGEADLWDSGRIESSRTLHVPYQGKPLAARARCFWKVRVWDDAGETASSEAARWSVGPLTASDWGAARWIGAPPEPARPFAEWRTRYGFKSGGAPTADTPKWVGIDLGEPREIDEVRFHGAMVPGTPNFHFPARVRIDVAEAPDFTGFTTVSEGDAGDAPADPAAQRAWSARFEPRKARYVRVYATKTGKHPHPKIAEHALALAELAALRGGRTVSSGAAVLAPDETASAGWAKEFLTDGVLEARPPRTDWHIPPSPLLRKAFTVDDGDGDGGGDIAHAEVSVTALGEYELRLNGQRVGDHQLAPEWTDYRQRVQYQTYDVTALVKRGDNAIAATLGDGWYAGRLAGTRWNADFPKRGLYGLNRRLLLRLDVRRADGTTQTIVSDGSWRIEPDGPIRSADHFLGETYDARKERPGWDAPGFDDAAWEPATVDDTVAVATSAQMNEPIRVTHTIKPVAITEPKPGVYVFKLPQTIGGWCRVWLDGPAGTKVTLRHAEWLNPDGTLFTAPYGGALSVDEYVLDGKGRRAFEPRFTYHGFQYVEVTGLPQKPDLGMLEGRVVSSDLRQAGSFECSDPLLNRIWSMAVWSQRGNQFSVPTDCPNRNERYGFGGDGLAFADTAMFNMDMAAFFAKWTRDWREAQWTDDAVPPFAPYPWFEGEKRHEEVMGWSDATVQVPWKLYQRYGDAVALERHYDSMKRFVDRVARQSKNHIWNVATVGDWLGQAMIKDVPGYPSEGGYTGLPNEVFGTAFAYGSASDLAAAATVLGRAEDARRYAQLAGQIRVAFNRDFVRPDGTVAGDNQSTYVLALDRDLLPPELRPAAARHLLREIDRYDGRLATGIIATPKILHVLSRFGHTDRAYALIQSKRFPSLGFMAEQGATTVWERWDNYLPGRGTHADGMQSYNHFAFGGQAAWLYQAVLGITPDPTRPAYEHVVIRPEPGGGLTWAEGEHVSIRGPIRSSWRAEGGEFTLELSIPPGVSASVFLPTDRIDDVKESGAPVARATGVAVAAGAEKDVAGGLRVQSGRYVFSCPLANKRVR